MEKNQKARRYFAHEAQGTLELELVRLGPDGPACSVRWATDPSDLAGRKFTACSGTATFLPGECFVPISVPAGLLSLSAPWRP